MSVVYETAHEEELNCIMIPVGQRLLLLPNVCVAEVVGSSRIEVAETGPAWLIGFTGWRGETLPVVDFGRMASGPESEPIKPRCLVVMNRARRGDSAAFYAFAAESVPRMLQLTGQDLISAGSDLGELDVMHVEVGTETATIPDLDCVEREITVWSGVPENRG